MRKFTSYFDLFIEKSLVVIVLLILSLSISSICLRWIEVACRWINPLVRHLVFLSIFLGGTLASGKGCHIGIDALVRYFESKNNVKLLLRIQKVSLIVTIIALGFLTYSGYTFFLIEKEYGEKIFFSLHSSSMVAIIPFGLGLICIRSILKYLDLESEQEKD